ncbi:hypothetical protein HanXRQr2_Chr16g0728401 [Helianthus annuus]|uniref:Uncharacterized protein n=1 Tax=Helianthus annuus TaxID=4232 RepID=A0A9K3GWE5_HELAN|nr:hypothetical protein HanXRQr2_Chr16g0728401 [Helianthus annuus]
MVPRQMKYYLIKFKIVVMFPVIIFNNKGKLVYWTLVLGMLVHLYLHSLERILVLAASSVGKRDRMVSNMG